MQWNLLLLVLMGHCSFITCHQHDYHFVNQLKNWSDAQVYCRKHHADLATIDNMEMNGWVKRENSDGAWIGLKNTNNYQWHWSLPETEFKENETKWDGNEPNNMNGIENCVCMKPGGKWFDIPCNTSSHFVCYNVTGTRCVIKEQKTWKEAQSYCVIKEQKTWTEAQSYCREKYTDLISGLSQTSEQTILDNIIQYVQQTAKAESSRNDCIHIGLFQDSWKWSDGSKSSFRYWESEYKSSGDCAMTKSTGKWSLGECTEEKPFFCRDDNLILIHENKTWEEALDYCQEKHDDLVSIHNEDIQKWVQKRVEKADSPYVWLGLRYTCTLDFWFWVRDEPLCYQNWAPGEETGDCKMSGAVEKGGEHRWFSLPDAGRFNFICSRRTI